MDQFNAKIINKVGFLEAELLKKASVRHAFLGKPWDFALLKSSEKLNQLLTTFSLEQIVFATQTHSDKVLEVLPQDLKDESFVQLGEADALFTKISNKKIALGVKTADCVPILIKAKTCVAVIHAGWKGLANGIILKTLAKIDLTGAVFAIGPAAKSDNYEVGKEVLEQIGVCAAFRQVHNRFYLDTAETANNILQSAGILKSQIANCNICTIGTENFYSYRRDKSTERNISLICLELN